MKLLIFALLVLPMAFAQNSKHMPAETASPATCTKEVMITDVIGPATVDLLKRVEKRAQAEACSSILLLVNTPGGSLESTRVIVEMILNAKIPYLCLISPSGGHAGSAGAIILQACHVNGALIGTNLGAATPVTMSGDLPQDLRQKILNDTRSWLESLTRLRGRSDKFGQDIILEAKAVTAEDALKLKAIDFVGPTLGEFMKFAEGREVKMSEAKMERVRTGILSGFEHDARYKVVSLLTDPQFAYMLLLGSLALIYFEITHPGVMVPGVLGGLGLIIALVALNKLDVEWGGLMLIFLGIALLIAEMFVPAFGILGVGGITAFVLGSLFLFDPVKNFGYRLPLGLIAPVVLIFAGVFVGVSYLMIKTRAIKKKGGFEDLIGVSAKVVKLDGPTEGKIELHGEIWNFQSRTPVNLNDTVEVSGHHELVLHVKKES